MRVVVLFENQKAYVGKLLKRAKNFFLQYRKGGNQIEAEDEGEGV